MVDGSMRRSFHSRALGALAGGILLAALAFASSALAAQTGSIAGTVTLQGGGSNPYIGDVSVCAYTLAEELKGCGNPTLDGEYTIEGLAGGEYKVGFSSTGLGYLDQYYDDKSSLAEAEPVPVTAGQTTTSIDAELHTAGKITGRVTSASTDDPIEGAEACAREVSGDEKQCGTTNANGEYTILRLNGRYTVEFHVPGGGDYLGQFYGGEPSFEYGRLVFSPSQELSVIAPGTISRIDAALAPGVFEEPVSTAPPAVSGMAVVGDDLSCSSGSWRGDPAPVAFTYTWLRDGAPIAGASESSYTAQSADEGRAISCKVVATNVAGNQIGTGQALSPSVTIAPGSTTGSPSDGSGGSKPPTETTTGVLGSTSLPQTTPLVTLTGSKVVVSGGSAPVRVACSQATCQGLIELVVQVVAKHHLGKAAVARKETLVLATGSFSLAKGRSRTVILHLTAAGKKMFAHANGRRPILAKLTLSVKGGEAVTESVLVT
jgi:hypothetical protein